MELDTKLFFLPTVNRVPDCQILTLSSTLHLLALVLCDMNGVGIPGLCMQCIMLLRFRTPSRVNIATVPAGSKWSAALELADRGQACLRISVLLTVGSGFTPHSQ